MHILRFQVSKYRDLQRCTLCTYWVFVHFYTKLCTLQCAQCAVCSTRYRSGDGMCQNLHNPSNLFVWRSCVSNLKGSNKFSDILKYQDRFAHVLIWKYALEILYLYMFITEQFSLIILWRSWDFMFCMPWGFMFLNLSRSTQFSFRVLCRSGGSKF